MYYCFVSEDFIGLEESDPLFIQAKYAKKSDRFIMCNLSSGDFFDINNNKFSVENKIIFLRTTCIYCEAAVNLLARCGADILEDLTDINKIENWDVLPISERRIIPVKREQVLNGSFNDEITDILQKCPEVFIKSRRKGFSLKISSQKVLAGDERLREILSSKDMCGDFYEELMISNYLEIKSDSFGKKEARFFVLNGKIANCSRALHSVKHSVPKKLLKKAEEVVSIINKQKDFPANYVLDLAEFVDGDRRFVDVLELNPITTSLCYINNSVFLQAVEGIEKVILSLGAGYEYCLDALESPERYVLSRSVGESFEYINECHFSL